MAQQENLPGQKRSYDEIRAEISAYYETRGVGTPDFVAFGDALLMAEVRTEQKDVKERVKQGVIPAELGQRRLAGISTRILSLLDIKHTHENMYKGFPDLYKKAESQITQAVQANPQANNTEQNALAGLRDLRNALVHSRPLPTQRNKTP